MSEQTELKLDSTDFQLPNDEVESFQTHFDRHVQRVTENAVKHIDRKIIAIAVAGLVEQMPEGSIELTKFEDGAIKAEFKRLKDQKWSKKESVACKKGYKKYVKDLILTILK